MIWWNQPLAMFDILRRKGDEMTPPSLLINYCNQIIFQWKYKENKKKLCHWRKLLHNASLFHMSRKGSGEYSVSWHKFNISIFQYYILSFGAGLPSASPWIGGDRQWKRINKQVNIFTANVTYIQLYQNSQNNLSSVTCEPFDWRRHVARRTRSRCRQQRFLAAGSVLTRLPWTSSLCKMSRNFVPRVTRGGRGLFFLTNDSF